jgi:hypothetical protein
MERELPVGVLSFEMMRSVPIDLATVAYCTIPVVIAAWASFHRSLRNSRSVSCAKIVLATVFLVFSVPFLVAINYAQPYADSAREDISTFAMMFIVVPVAVIGTPFCIGAILGTLTGMLRAQRLKQWPKTRVS